MLKPCPFCGGRAKFGEHRWAGNGALKAHYIHCVKCNVHGYSRNTKEKAIAAWNRRASPSGGLGSKSQAGFDGDVAVHETAMPWRPIEEAPKDGRTIEVQGVMHVHHIRLCKFPIMPADWRPDTPQTAWTFTAWRELPPPLPAQQARASISRGDSEPNPPEGDGESQGLKLSDFTGEG